jgi:hypothetical protein
VTDHPPWCLQGAACTADEPPARGLRRTHRGEPTHRGARGDAVSNRLVQEPDEPVRVALTAVGWGTGRTIRLSLDDAAELIQDLSDLVLIGRGVPAEAAPRQCGDAGR